MPLLLKCFPGHIWVQGKEDSNEKDDYYSSKPFAAGGIFVANLLDSLICQAYYSPKITEILE